MSITSWFRGSSSGWSGSRGSLRCGSCLWLSLLSRFRASSSGSITSLIVFECTHIILIFYKYREDCTQRQILGSSIVQNSSDSALFLHFEINGGLICLDGTQYVSRSNLVSDLNMPFANITLKNYEVKLTFSMVGERLGISNLIWSGNDEKALSPNELNFIKPLVSTLGTIDLNPAIDALWNKLFAPCTAGKGFPNDLALLMREAVCLRFILIL